MERGPRQSAWDYNSVSVNEPGLITATHANFYSLIFSVESYLRKKAGGRAEADSQ
jgi:hypothetical protein